MAKKTDGEIEETVDTVEYRSFFKTRASHLTMIIKAPKYQYTQEGQKIILDPGITVKFTNQTYFPKDDEEMKLLLEYAKKKPYIFFVSEKDLKRENEKRIAMERAAREVEEKYK